jgi:hypothetical protein
MEQKEKKWTEDRILLRPRMDDDFPDADEPFMVENPGWKHRAMTESFSMTTGHRQCRYLDFLKDNQIILPGNYAQHHFVYIPNRNAFAFFHIQGPYIFASALSDFRRSIRLAWTTDFSFPRI